MTTYKTAESVTEGHPDKLCDLIADSILDECLRKDSDARCACEVLATRGSIVVAGEITCSHRIRIKKIVRRVLKNVGYDPFDFAITVKVHRQSPDIAQGVDRELGAGDQGIMYGYACNETEALLPMPVVLANRLTRRLTQVYKDGIVPGIRPDGKAQVTVEYENDKPKRIQTIVLSVQHDPRKETAMLVSQLKKSVIFPAFACFPIDCHTKILINPSGKFIIGGPEADTGLTGRKLMVDTYGGLVLQGGGAMSGKDATKVDRTGAYYARYAAKNIVAAGLCDKCTVSVAYAIGKADPVMVEIDTHNTENVPLEDIQKILQRYFCFKPSVMIDTLNLKSPIYAMNCTNCHFMHSLAPWEDTALAEEIREAIIIPPSTEA